MCPTFSFHLQYELTTILGVLRGLVHFSPAFQLCWSRWTRWNLFPGDFQGSTKFPLSQTTQVKTPKARSKAHGTDWKCHCSHSPLTWQKWSTLWKVKTYGMNISSMCTYCGGAVKLDGDSICCPGQLWKVCNKCGQKALCKWLKYRFFSCTFSFLHEVQNSRNSPQMFKYMLHCNYHF